jgi:hypothetical protein
LVVGVLLNRQVHVHADRSSQFLGQVAQQPGGPGQQGEPAQELGRQAQICERGTARTGAVKRQRAAKDLRVYPADRLEQAQMRPAQPLLVCDRQQRWRARVGDLVHRVPEPWDEAAGFACAPHGTERKLVEPGVIGWLWVSGQRLGQESPGVLCHSEEPGAAA